MEEGDRIESEINGEQVIGTYGDEEDSPVFTLRIQKMLLLKYSLWAVRDGKRVRTRAVRVRLPLELFANGPGEISEGIMRVMIHTEPSLCDDPKCIMGEMENGSLPDAIRVEFIDDDGAEGGVDDECIDLAHTAETIFGTDFDLPPIVGI